MDHERIYPSIKGVNSNEDLSLLTTTFTTGTRETNNLRISQNQLNSSQSRIINSLHQLKLLEQEKQNSVITSSLSSPTTFSTIIVNNNNGRNMLKSTPISSLSLSTLSTNSKERANIIRNINFLKNSVENFFTSNTSVYEEGSSSFNINDFPEEILIHILKWLSPFDLRICSLVSSYWSIVSSKDPIWYEKCYGQWHWCCNINEEKLNRLDNNNNNNNNNNTLTNSNLNLKSTWKEFYKFWAKEYLKHTEWWQESFSREDANQILSTMGKGTFLIRASTSKKNCLVISYNVHAQTPNHMLLSYLGLYTGVSLYDEIGRVYPTLASLVRGKKSWLKRPFNACSTYTNKSNQKQQYIDQQIQLSLQFKQPNKQIDRLALLHIACKWCFKTSIIKLLELGADINFKYDNNNHNNNNNGNSSGNDSSSPNLSPISSIIIDSDDSNGNSSGIINRYIKKVGKPPLFYAIGFVHGQPQSSVRLEIVKILLENQNLNINQLDSKGRSICHIACKQHQQDSLDILKLLLKCGANPHLSAPNGLYPLHVAVKENNLKMVKLLLSFNNSNNIENQDENVNNNSNNSNNKYKININCKIELTPISRINDDYGTTPLHLAASKSLCPIIKLMIEQPDIDIDFRDNKERTALHRAVSNTQDWVNMARFGKPLQHHYSHQVIEMLLKNGKSNPNLLDIQGKTPLHIAVEKGHRKSTYLIATTLRESYSKELIQSTYTKQSLYESLKIGSESKDIQKIVADVNYSIMCGYDEDFIEPLDKTIIDHYNNINDILKREFFILLK